MATVVDQHHYDRAPCTHKQTEFEVNSVFGGGSFARVVSGVSGRRRARRQKGGLLVLLLLAILLLVMLLLVLL
jgi:hypothetical protein